MFNKFIIKNDLTANNLKLKVTIILIIGLGSFVNLTPGKENGQIDGQGEKKT